MSRRGTMRTAGAITARVRACARLRAAWAERLWSEGESSPDQGLAIAPGEVRRILIDPRSGEQQHQSFLREESQAVLVKDAAAAGRALKADRFWKSIGELFALTPNELDLLALCVAVELEPKLGRVLAYLADDTRATHPTATMAAALFAWSEAPPEAMNGLLRWRLAYPLGGESAWRATTAWQADPAVVLSVKAERWIAHGLERSTRIISAGEARLLPCLYPELLARMVAELASESLCNGDRKCEVALVGPEGSGRETLAGQFAAATNRSLLSVTTSLLRDPAVVSGGPKGDELVQAARLAQATGSILYWRDAEQVSAQEWSELRALKVFSLRGTQMAPATATHRYTLQPLPTARRLEAWAHYSDETPPAIVRTQRLTPAEVRLVAQAAPDDSVHMALQRAAQANGELMQPLACPYTWDDLVVSPSLKKMLKDFESQVLLRWEVYEEWDFARLTHLGQGISALFAGPSGTGKTMAAQVLARSLGLELFRVDLAGVVNKYIGETEKRLRNVFDACERSGALLFFDEADALFGNRMQVKDSHDRFANIEIDYLLQRIEQFDGIAILATNRKNDLDTAFLRRLRFVMDFLNPDKQERKTLWEKSLPPFAASGERITSEIDMNLLAAEMDLNGAQIKSIALGAAFLARGSGSVIGMEHIEVSALREFGKQGQLMRTSLLRGAAL